MSEKLQIIQGDCLEVLKTLPDGIVQTCVTSPPYYGLRDYGTPAQVWGGSPDCEHEWQSEQWYRNGGSRSKSADTFMRAGAANAANIKKFRWMTDTRCPLCGAWRGSLGLEPTPELYVEHLVLIFREVRRVLRDDGTLWLVIGDSYANDSKWGGASGGMHAKALHGNTGIGRYRKKTGLKPKELIGIPWMAAFALRQDGWYLRQDVIWAKPNPMPESVTDRCTKSHEYIFLFSKSKRYYFDYEAIEEPMVACERERRLREKSNGLRSVYALARDGKTGIADQSATGACRNAAARQTLAVKGTKRKRSVWTVSTKSYKGAHFATFPPELIVPCTKAGSPAGALVLDLFGGSGTTGKVALELGRRAILIELNPEYLPLINERTKTTLGLPLERGEV